MIELTGMPALTLQRPWPYAITHLSKRVENRTWYPPDSLDRFFIHAGKTIDPDGAIALRDRGFTWTQVDAALGAQSSAIVAVARLAHVCRASRHGDALTCECGKWAVAGQLHWRLADELIVLPNPVPCPGRQRLWYPSRDVLAAVKREVASCVSS